MASAPPSPAPTLLRPPSFHPATVEWTPGQQPRFIVINPMHIISLQKRTKTFAVKAVEKIKSFSEKWFSHILLLIFLLIYASLGALLFQYLEAPLEMQEKESIIRIRNEVISRLWRAARVDFKTESEWVELAHLRLKEYELQVEEHFLSGTPGDSEKTEWSFVGSLFYAGTVFTTIGYGHICPATTGGRAATIIYAFIGIPFLLMILADLGRLFTRAIKAVFYYVRLFYHTGKIRKARRLGRRATAVPAQYMSIAWNKMPYMVYQNRMKKQGSMDVTDPETVEDDVELGKSKNTSTQDERDTPELDKKDTKQREKKKVTHMDEDHTQDEDQTQDEDVETIKTVVNDDVDDEFNLPVSLAIILLLGYMMLGAFMFTLWEEWTFFESFYFVFISMSTIGFGDYVPDHPMFMMGTFIYLLFGLALTSMCINVIQEKLSATFEMAKLRIGTTMGLDANMIMEEDLYPEKSDSPDGKPDSKGSRRGSKVPPPKTDLASENKDKENDTIENKNSDQMKNGIKNRSPPIHLDIPIANHT